MPLTYRLRTLAVKPEGTYGTAETLTNAEVIRATDATLDVDATVVNREKSDGGQGTDVGVPVGAKLMLAFKNFAHGDGSTGDPNWAAALFPSCGMIQSSSSYATSTTQSSWKGMTAAMNRQGRRVIGRGFMGNLKQIWTAGKPVEFQWDYVGAAVASPTLRTDTTQLSSITYESAVPPIFAGSGSLTIDSATTYKVSKVEIDLNNSPFAREDPNAVGGYIGGWLTNPSPTIKLDAEAVLVATKDWGTAFSAGTQITIVLVAGATTGNIITTTATNCQLKSFPKEQDRNNLLVDALEFQVNGTLTTAFT